MSLTELNSDNYLINYANPGKVVIFGNGYFENGRHLPIISDVTKIQQTFEKLNFQIIRNLELTSVEILKSIKDLKKLNYKNDSCFICFITTHGDSGDFLYAKDNKGIHISEFIDPIKQIESLKNKPKLFFIDACRGNKLIDFDKSINRIIRDNDIEQEAQNYGKAKEETDLLIGFATIDKYVSKAYEIYGSLYITKLCEVIENNTGDEILHILLKVHSELTTEKFQVAEFRTTFKRKFFFDKQKNEIEKPLAFCSKYHTC